jgi:asparagine synthetase B (glutamine-hydrolysing)
VGYYGEKSYVGHSSHGNIIRNPKWTHFNAATPYQRLLRKIRHHGFNTPPCKDLLVKMDIATTMANSLEGRSPFCAKNCWSMHLR